MHEASFRKTEGSFKRPSLQGRLQIIIAVEALTDTRSDRRTKRKLESVLKHHELEAGDPKRVIPVIPLNDRENKSITGSLEKAAKKRDIPSEEKAVFYTLYDILTKKEK